MYSVESMTLGPLSANCYFITDEKSRELMIIDPGDDGQFLSDKIFSKQLTPIYMIATHGHFDHVMGAGIVSVNYGLPLHIHPDDVTLVKNSEPSARHFLGHMHTDPPPVIFAHMKPTQKVQSDSFRFTVLALPGHTPGGIGIYFENDHFIFCGDTLFADGFVGRSDFSYSNKQDLESSIDVLLQLPENTIVYPGHGDACTVGDLISIHRMKGEYQ